MRSSKLFLGFLIVALATMSWAQTATTSLRGTVTDAGGAVIPKATVTLSRAETGFTRTVTTDDQGAYQFLQIPPATYTLEANAGSFAKASQNVQLLVNTPATVNVTLGVQAASTTIDVSGEAPQVNTQDATLGAAFNNQQILALPFEGRDPVAILSLQPGVTFITSSDNSDSNFDSRAGSVNGARSDQTNVTLDGVDNNDQVGGTAFSGALRSTLDSLQEFRVVTSVSNADSGRSSGGQVSLVTKTGTNNFHGSLYEYHRPTVFRANDWFNKQAQLAAGEENRPAKFIRNTYGGSIGGPIMKDRLFFFATYEGQRKRESVQVTRTIPSPELRQGILRYFDDDGNIVTLNPTDIAGMDSCVSGGATPNCPWGPGVNPNVLAYWSAYPEPNTLAVGDGLNLQGYTFAAPLPQDRNTYIAKLDWNATSDGAHRFYIRGNLLGDTLVPGLGSEAQFPGQEPSQDVVNTSKGMAVGYTATLSSTMVNNFRYGYIRQQTVQGGPNQVAYVNFRSIDEPVFFGNSLGQTVPVHNFVNDTTWSKGQHTIQFGGNWRLITNRRASNAQNFFGAETNPSWTSDAAIANTGGILDPGAFGFPSVSSTFESDYDIAAIALIGSTPEVNAVFNQDKTGALIPTGDIIRRSFRNNEFELYLQDSWRAKPNLTLTYGLRYTLLQPPFETNGEQVAPTTSLHDWFEQRREGMLSGEVVNPILTLDVSGQANGGKPYWDWDKKNFGPRFAFAYSPNAESGLMRTLFGGPGRSSIRGGYGLYYDHFGIGVVNTFDKQGSFGLTTAITNPAGIQTLDASPRFTQQGVIPSTDAFGNSLVAPPPGSFPVTPPADLDFGFAIYWGLDDKLKTPYSHVFDFSVTRELPGDFVFEAAYVGRLGRRLLQQNDLAMPLNLTDPSSGQDYFTAATMLAQAAENGTDIANLAPIPYFENLFGNAAGTQAFPWACAPNFDGGATYTATQNMYDMFSCFLHNETTALFITDLFCDPGCANGQTFQYFSPQFSSLYAWASIGSSSYHAGQFSLRRRLQRGFQFDLNYTLSKSIDMGSDAERLSLFDSTSGGFGQIINAWDPSQNRGVSDFDARHQINASYVAELPFGQKRHWGSGWNGVVDAILGGWQSSGVFRWSSGLPFGLGPGLGNWPTNWELTGSVIPNGDLPETGVFIVDGTPNVFKDPEAAAQAFRFAYPGESGTRNSLRGPGIFNIDLGLSKNWNFTETQRLQFRWEVFNVTNSVRFDPLNMSFNNGSISNSGLGNFLAPTNSLPRVMQFALRYEF
jgi:hypothetical protein